MGVGGKFWDLLKPYVRQEDFDYLRDKRVAVDLSFWIVQHETAMKSTFVRSPHLRLTFFRTINLFSKFGVYPVFVVDGTPSPLKSQARIARFFRLSGLDMSNLPVAEEGVSVERNAVFKRCVQECVELLELLGMPVIKARGEAEALCAQLNAEGLVDACLTSDSDAFLYGAKCVIKSLRPNSKEPFECYYMSDIEAGLGLKRKHLIGISLLVGSDHDLNGVQGIGIDTALRFVQSFDEDEIFDRMHDIGIGAMKHLRVHNELVGCSSAISDNSSKKIKAPHCSKCGHPGNKKSHLSLACDYCKTIGSSGCLKKPADFRCDCPSCDMNIKQKDQKKRADWNLRVCKKISMEHNFPNDDIIELYMRNNHGYFNVTDGPSLCWKSPETEMLADFLAYHLLWQPSYLRQRLVPMISTIFLRETASNATDTSLMMEQYKFDSIKRIKVRYGHQFFMVKWNRATNWAGCGIESIDSGNISNPNDDFDTDLEGVNEIDESVDLLDEPNVGQIQVDGNDFLLTDENMALVQAAFPQNVSIFMQEKNIKQKDQKKRADWNLRVCKKISMEHNFPNDDIIELYMRNNHGYFNVTDGPSLCWKSPETEMLADFLAYHLLWQPSYLRQRLVPMISTIFLRETASNATDTSLMMEQYKFDSIKRIKVRYGHQFFMVKWNRATNWAGCGIESIDSGNISNPNDDFDTDLEGVNEIDESVDLLDEPNVGQIQVDGNDFLLTDENMALVQAAFPQNVSIFMQEKELKESKRRKPPNLVTHLTPANSPKAKGVQLSITNFYRSSKVHDDEKPEDVLTESSSKLGNKSKERKEVSSPNYPKSVRRRLLL